LKIDTLVMVEVTIRRREPRATTDVGPLTDAGDRLSATVMVQIDSESEFSGLVLTAQTRGR
jgi:hypothetical protein